MLLKIFSGNVSNFANNTRFLQENKISELLGATGDKKDSPSGSSWRLNRRSSWTGAVLCFFNF